MKKIKKASSVRKSSDKSSDKKKNTNTNTKLKTNVTGQVGRPRSKTN